MSPEAQSANAFGTSCTSVTAVSMINEGFSFWCAFPPFPTRFSSSPLHSIPFRSFSHCTSYLVLLWFISFILFRHLIYPLLFQVGPDWHLSSSRTVICDLYGVLRSAFMSFFFISLTWFTKSASKSKCELTVGTAVV